MGSTTSKTDSTSGKGKVHVTIHKLGSDQQIQFEDGDTVEHLIRAVAASEDLELRISGKPVKDMDKSTTLGSIAGKDRAVEADLGSRKGSHGC